jgi:protein-L-isoaspartate O-methyltransferase
VPRYYRRAVHPVVLDVADPGPRAADHIYADRSLLTHHPDHDGAQSRASRPGHIAHLLEAAALPAARRVLHVGAGVGYTTALAAHVAERARVVAVETSHRVAADGADAIDRLSLGRRVHYYRGEGYAGCAPEAGYDRVLVTTGVTGISPIWLDQLTDRGFIVAPVYAGGLFPLLAVGRGPAGTGLVGRPVLGAAEFEPAIAPDVIASVGPDGQDLAREAERLVEGWLAAGRPRAADWEVRLRLNTATGAPLYTPYRWVLTGRRR